MSDKTIESQIAVISINIEYIKRDVQEVKKTLRDNYVTQTEFKVVKSIVFGLVAVVLVSFAENIVSIARVGL